MAITSTKIKQYKGSLSEVQNTISSLGSITELNVEMAKTGFTGWRTAPNGDGVLVNDLSLVDGQVVDLYSTIPNLVTLTKTVRFVDYNDTVIQTQQVEIGKSATRPQNPTRKNFKFWKWDTPFDCVTQDLTVKALYVLEGEEYTFTYADGTKSKTLCTDETTNEIVVKVKSFSAYEEQLEFTVQGATLVSCVHDPQGEVHIATIRSESNAIATLTQQGTGKSLSLTIKSSASAVKIPDFDHLVVRYYWTASDGRDLDTATAFSQTSTGMDDRFVGWSMNGGYDVANGLLTHGGDNVTSGNECVCIKFKDFYNKNYESLVLGGRDSIDLELWGTWYNYRGNGGVRILLTAYKGGEMVQDPTNRYNKINPTGQKVAETFLDVNLRSEHGIGQWRNRVRTGYALMATVNYNILTNTARIFA